jgi:hypothetical protein
VFSISFFSVSVLNKSGIGNFSLVIDNRFLKSILFVVVALALIVDGNTGTTFTDGIALAVCVTLGVSVTVDVSVLQLLTS